MTTPGPEPPEETDEVPPEPVFDNVEEWLTERFVPMYRRPLGGEFRWCAQWFLHAEAISRLTALWRSWETLRLEPAVGMAEWYQHLDHHLQIIMGARGPFYQCTETNHLEPHQARIVPAPPGYWDLEPPPVAGPESWESLP
jgi:Domain of unknown function (DUF4913)